MKCATCIILIRLNCTKHKNLINKLELTDGHCQSDVNHLGCDWQNCVGTPTRVSKIVCIAFGHAQHQHQTEYSCIENRANGIRRWCVKECYVICWLMLDKCHVPRHLPECIYIKIHRVREFSHQSTNEIERQSVWTSQRLTGDISHWNNLHFTFMHSLWSKYAAENNI